LNEKRAGAEPRAGPLLFPAELGRHELPSGSIRAIVFFFIVILPEKLEILPDGYRAILP